MEYYKAIIPALVASCFSYVIFAIIVHLGLGPFWDLPAYEMGSVFDFAWAFFFAIIATVIGWGFIFCTKFFKSAFAKIKSPIYVKTLIGGILLGIIAYYLQRATLGITK